MAFDPRLLAPGYGAEEQSAMLEKLMAQLRAFREPMLKIKEQKFQKESFDKADRKYDKAVSAYEKKIQNDAAAVAAYEQAQAAHEAQVQQTRSQYEKQLADWERQNRQYAMRNMTPQQAWDAGYTINGLNKQFTSYSPGGRVPQAFQQGFSQMAQSAQQPGAAPLRPTYGAAPSAPQMSAASAPSFQYQPVAGKYAKMLDADTHAERMKLLQTGFLGGQQSDPMQALRQAMLQASQQQQRG